MAQDFALVISRVRNFLERYDLGYSLCPLTTERRMRDLGRENAEINDLIALYRNVWRN
jgi:hypothetical protein